MLPLSGGTFATQRQAGERVPRGPVSSHHRHGTNRDLFVTVLPPVCTPPCSAHATCKENNTCECNLSYEGDGITCTGESCPRVCKTPGPCGSGAGCGQSARTSSCPFPSGLRHFARICPPWDSVSLVGLLIPDPPTSQVTVLKSLCRLKLRHFIL